MCRECGLLRVRSRRDDVKKSTKESLNMDDVVHTNVATATHEVGIRKWLVYTGCPFDLVVENDLNP